MKPVHKKLTAPEINRKIGLRNRARIKRFFVEHPGATRQECAKSLGMNACVVGRHVDAIRQEWQIKRVLTIRAEWD